MSAITHEQAETLGRVDTCLKRVFWPAEISQGEHCIRITHQHATRLPNYVVILTANPDGTWTVCDVRQDRMLAYGPRLSPARLALAMIRCIVEGD